MSRFHRRAALALLLVLGALRLAHWGAPLTGDEAYTLRHFVSQPVSYIRSNYPVPNNHVLLSIVLHVVESWSPKRQVMTLADIRGLQLPSVLASVGALWLVWSLGRMLCGAPVALLALMALGLSYWHLLYSHMLRGYSLSVFFSLLSLWLVARALLRRRYGGLLALPAVLAAAHYLIPVNAYFTAGLVPAIAWALYARSKRASRAPLRRPRKGEAPPADGPARAALLFAGALGAGGLITFLLYKPILEQVLRSAQSLSMGPLASLLATPQRLRDAAAIVAADGGWFAVVFVLVALGGAAALLLSRRRRLAGVLLLAWIATPVLIATAQGTLPFTRTYLNALPAWALLFAAGVYAGWTALRARLPAAGRAGLLAPLALCAALHAGQARRFLEWNRGLDLRRALLPVVADTREEDDFAVIVSTRLANGSPSPDPLSYEYYGFASGALPYERLLVGRDYPFVARRRRYFIAEDERELAELMERSGLSAHRERAEAFGRVGRMGIYRLVLEPRAGDGSFARGLDYFLRFEDGAAAARFEAALAEEPGNIYARLYLAELEAARGRRERAAELLRWYLSPGKGPEPWFLEERAARALQGLSRGGAWPVPPRRSEPSAWEAYAAALADLGSWERALSALERAYEREPTPERLLLRGQLRLRLRRYAAAARDFQELSARLPGSPAPLYLAHALMLKGRVEEARAALAAFASRHPAHPAASDLHAQLSRL